jgi:membrane-associated phospholipid phosphatase
LAAALVLFSVAGQAQSVGGFFAREKVIWTSPLHMDKKQWGWVALAGAGTAGLIVADTRISRGLPNSSGQLDWGRRLSRFGGSYGALGISAGILAVGAARSDSKLKQAGWMAGESAVHAFAVTYLLKMATTRERPRTGSGRGHFFSGFEEVATGNNSFPSGHSMGSWAVASAVAHHYKGKKYVPWVMYGLATLMSASRVAAQRHYVSDVAVGAGMGFLIGRMVERRY